MGIEIEHKYLVRDDTFKEMAQGSVRIRQGYLQRDPERTVRIRVKGDMGYITIKGMTTGDSRAEYEYEIPAEDAENLLGMCQGIVLDKTRWLVPFEGYLWEIDEYYNPEFPTVAEIELNASAHTYPIPGFIGKEVTGDPRYYNSNIR